MEEQLISLLQKELARPVSAGQTFDALDVDSLDFVDLITKIEDEFSVRIPDEEFEHIVTVKDLADSIRKKLC